MAAICIVQHQNPLLDAGGRGTRDIFWKAFYRETIELDLHHLGNKQ